MKRRKIITRKFKAEKDAKNMAYAFIVSRGYVEEFFNFERRNRGTDPMKLCCRLMEDYFEHEQQSEEPD